MRDILARNESVDFPSFWTNKECIFKGSKGFVTHCFSLFHLKWYTGKHIDIQAQKSHTEGGGLQHGGLCWHREAGPFCSLHIDYVKMYHISHTHTHTQCITMHEELHWKMQVLKKLFQQMMVIQNREMEHDSHLKELVCSEVRCLYREPWRWVKNGEI